MAASSEFRNGSSECVKLRLNDYQLISKVRYFIDALTLMDSVHKDTLGLDSVFVM